MAVPTLGYVLATQVTPADRQERAQVKSLAREVQDVAGETVKVAFQRYTGGEPAAAAKAEGIDPQAINLPEAKKGFMLLPRR